MNSPLVSIIIPAYNASKFVEETILSVSNQTYKNLELILVNDGSIDETKILVTKLIEKDSRFRYIEKENSGVCDARNKGFLESKGEYVLFLDADDVLHPKMIENCISYIHEHENVHVIYIKGQVIDEFSRKKDRFIEVNFIRNQSDILNWRVGFSVMPSSTLIERKVLEDVGLWDNTFSTAADQELFIRISTKYPIFALNELLFYYRIHNGNMHQNIALMEKDHMGVFKKARKNKLFKSFFFERKCFGNLHLILAGSWWVNGKNKQNGLKHLALAMYYDPGISLNLIKKFINK